MNDNFYGYEQRTDGKYDASFLSEFCDASLFASHLNKRITSVNILPAGIRNAFMHFINRSKLDNGFTLCDLIGLYDKCVSGANAYAAPGYSVLAVTGTPSPQAEQKLSKMCINGIYSLIDRSHGFAIDIDGMSFKSLEHTRFLACPEKKTKSFIRKLASEGVNLKLLGLAATDGSITVCSGSENLLSINKSQLPAYGDTYTLNIDNSYCDAFKAAYFEASRYISLASSGFASHLVLPERQSAESLFVTLLAVFAAQNTYAFGGVTIGFGDKLRSEHLPSFIPNGSFVYMYVPAYDAGGYPNVRSCMQMNSALRDFSVLKRSVSVVPVSGTPAKTASEIGVSISFACDADTVAAGGALLVFLNRRDAYGKCIGVVGGIE